jgi:hypothetical protein
MNITLRSRTWCALYLAKPGSAGMSTAAGGRNEPRYIDALASDVRTIDVGDEPSARPESSVNGGGAALAANFHRGHLESFGLRVEASRVIGKRAPAAERIGFEPGAMTS